MDFESLYEVGVSMQVQLVQESCFTTVNEIYDQFNQFVNSTYARMDKFIITNQVMIKDIYSKLKGSYGDIEVSNIIDICYVLGSYKEYIESMYDYISNILSGKNDETGIKMNLRQMQEKDRTFFNSNINSDTETVSDAMKNIEAIIDLKELLATLLNNAKTILTFESDACLKKELLSLYTKSVMSFYLQAINVIIKTYEDIVVKIDSGKELKLESVRPYKYF